MGCLLQGSWWCHQMETFSTLLALCAGNSPVLMNSPNKGQWRRALMFSFICGWINDWVNNREAGDLRRHRGHYDVNVMFWRKLTMLWRLSTWINMYESPAWWISVNPQVYFGFSVIWIPVACDLKTDRSFPVASGSLGCLLPSIPDSKVHGANMGSTWDRQDPGGTQVGHMSFAIWDMMQYLLDRLSNHRIRLSSWWRKSIYVCFGMMYETLRMRQNGCHFADNIIS